MTRYTGKVLWFDERDGFGIIKAVLGTKLQRDVHFYVDSSVIQAPLKSGQKVTFEHNAAIRECPCAHKVEVLP